MQKAPLTSVLLLLLLSAATGCTRYYWSKPGATAEQLTQDDETCVRQAAGALPAGAALEAVEQYYRACLTSRGYGRDKQTDPPPPGSYRGIENGEDFDAAVQAAIAKGPQPGFEQQLAQLDNLKARGRITETEYAAMRKRLVDGVTPGALTPAPPDAATAPPPRSLAGTGSASGEQISLVGRSTGIGPSGSLPPFSLSLTWEGAVLRGTSTGPNNLPRVVELRRDRPKADR